MIIDIINVIGMAVLKAKNHAPVRAYRHRPIGFQFAFELVQPESWQVHIGNRKGGIEPCQNITQLDCMFRHNAARIVVLMQAFQSFMARPFNITTVAQ